MSKSNPLNIRALVKGPGAVETELVLAGFFTHEEDEPELIGGAKQLNDGLKGLVMKLRTDGTFKGEVGETYLFQPDQDTIPAKQVVLVGLGEKSSFSLDAAQSAGKAALKKAIELGVKDAALAPEVRDAGVTEFSASAVAQAFVEGIMSEYKKQLDLQGEDNILLKTFKILAGPQHEASANEGVNQALEKA